MLVADIECDIALGRRWVGEFGHGLFEDVRLESHYFVFRRLIIYFIDFIVLWDL
jgi:hypothetical protein